MLSEVVVDQEGQVPRIGVPLVVAVRVVYFLFVSVNVLLGGCEQEDVIMMRVMLKRYHSIAETLDWHLLCFDLSCLSEVYIKIPYFVHVYMNFFKLKSLASQGLIHKILGLVSI